MTIPRELCRPYEPRKGLISHERARELILDAFGLAAIWAIEHHRPAHAARTDEALREALEYLEHLRLKSEGKEIHQ